MKKIISILIACIMMLSCIGVFSMEADMLLIAQKPITVTYNGENIQFPDAQPMIQNSRALVPARAIMERAKLTVEFDASTRTVTAQKDGLSIVMVIDNAQATVTENGVSKTVILEEPARLISDRTYVPIRFIAESMNLKVNWNSNYREVVIIDTKEWKQEIAECSALLTMLLDAPMHSENGYSSNSSGNISISLYGPDGKNLRLNLILSGTEVFDGENTGSYVLLETDLSPLKTFLAEEADPDTINKIAKPQKIDLDTIVDAEGNLYIKSSGILKIMQDYDLDELADTIGSNYVKIPLTELLSGDMNVNRNILANSKETAWDYYEALILGDDMLYTQSVAFIDLLVSTLANTYHNDLTKVTTLWDGSEVWTHTLNQEAYINNMLKMTELTAKAAGTPMTEAELATQKEILEATKMETTLKVTVRGGVPVKSEVLYKVDSTDPTVPKNEAVRTVYTVNIGSSQRNFNNRTDKKITIPKNVILLDNLLGFSLTEYMTLAQ